MKLYEIKVDGKFFADEPTFEEDSKDYILERLQRCPWLKVAVREVEEGKKG
ncbi:hypothetical protein LJK87_01160 [Paenibacillus sp. P25]|nr:hypothetical protein LJK87_01160 [Paenibacillus sp. P25]